MTSKTKNKVFIRGTLSIILLVIFIFSYGQQAKAEIADYQKDFTNKWKVSAVKFGRQYGIFPSQILAQGAFESDWGRSYLAVNHNNLFGIKGDGDGGWAKFKTQDECVEYYILNFFKTRADGYEDMIKTNSPIGMEEHITKAYAPLSDGNSSYLSVYPQIVENEETNFLQYDLIAFPNEIKSYADIEEVRDGKKTDLTMHSAGKIDWKGKKPTITDKDIKVDGIIETTDDSKGEKETNLVVSYGFDEDSIPGMPKKRDYEDDNANSLGNDSVKIEVNEADQLLAWRSEYDNRYQYTPVNVFRALITSIGRILIMYSVVLIACFMYDQSKIHEGSLFRLVTLGRLEVSYDGTSTFRDKSSSVKQVNKSNLTFIVLILVLLGILMVNGYIYVFLSYILDTYNNAMELIRNSDIFNNTFK